MTTIAMLCTAFLAGTLAVGATAQTAPSTAASMPMAGAAMPRDCGKPLARHDHGAERGSPAPKAKTAPCEQGAGAAKPAQAASAPSKRPKHDHGRFHKNS